MPKSPKSSSESPASPSQSRAEALFAIATRYGRKSFDNYAQIRSLAETVCDGFDRWLSDQGPYVFLVPPEGRFTAKNYQSAAFSVAGKGYLPLKPISFGLAVRVSDDEDYMRIRLECHKEGDRMLVRLHDGTNVSVDLPKDGKAAVSEAALEPLYQALYDHLIHFFQDHVDDYDNGHYGVKEIGFDLQRMNRD